MVERILLLVFRMKTLKQKIMTREDRLKQCRYYKGGYNCPESLDVMEVGFWIAEESFVSAEEWERNDTMRLLSISGLDNYRQKWQGFAEDEIVATVFDYETKSLEGEWDVLVPWFVNSILPSYLGLTSI